MSFFCKLDNKSLAELKESRIRFEEGIKKLNVEEKESLLLYMYKSRHNLLVDLTEEKNKNLCLIAFSSIVVLYKIFSLMCR